MDRRRTDRRRQMEMVLASIFLSCQVPITGNEVKDAGWPIAGKHSHKLGMTSPQDSGQRFQNQRDAGNGSAQGGTGDTATSSCSAAPATPTAFRGFSPSEISRNTSLYSTAAITRHALDQTTCSSEPHQTTPETWTPREDGESVTGSPCGNPVTGIPLNRTRQIISGHDLFLGLLFRAVNALQVRVLGYLTKAESREQDVWHQQDYRVAQVVLCLADEGHANPYSKAFFQLYGVKAHAIRFWWRDRAVLYRLCELGGSCTPLLHRDIASRLNELIPDYDYSQLSPVAPLLPPRAHPANTPAPVRPRTDTGAGDKEIL